MMGGDIDTTGLLSVQSQVRGLEQRQFPNDG